MPLDTDGTHISENALTVDAHQSSTAKDLCRDMVETMLAQAAAVALKGSPGNPAQVVDLNSVWKAGDGARSVETAVEAIVAAGLKVAHDIVIGMARLPVAPEPGRAEQSTEADELVSVHQLLYGAPAGALVDPAPPEELFWPATPVPELPVYQPPVLDHPVYVPRVDTPAVPAPWVAPPAVYQAPSLPVAAPRTLSSRSGSFTFFTWVRNIGAIIGLFVVWQLWGTSIAQHHDQNHLQTSFQAAIHAHHATIRKPSGAPSLLPADQIVPMPAEGSAVAQLQVPAIGVDQYVVQGTAANDLSEGPGHYIGTAAPGQAGNVAIAGHRTTHGAPFNRLGVLAVGDPIYLTTTSGERLTYVVSQAPVAVSPTDVEVLNNFGDNRITLTTCNPEFSATQRLVVVGELQQPASSTKTAPKAVVKPTEYHVVNPVSASWDWLLLPTVALEAGVLLLLSLSNRWFTAWFSRTGRWFVLVPVWAAGLYLLFQTLTSFLPSTF
jgi:sortase A